MSYTQEELDLFESVKATGICHDNTLTWKKFMDGTGVNDPVAKAKTECPTCLREYIKLVQVVDLEAI